MKKGIRQTDWKIYNKRIGLFPSARFSKFCLYIVLPALLLFFSCEKEITVDLPIPEKKLVVEGYIELGAHPYVILSKNSPYFDKIDSATLMKKLVLNATVTVSDGAVTDTLTIQYNPYIFPFLIYGTTKITGQAGGRYELRVMHEDKVYSAVTTIPEPVLLDSIWFRKEQDSDSLGMIWFRFKDPPDQVNFYRYFSKTPGRDTNFVHPFISSYDDQLINGKDVDFYIYHGRDPFWNRNDDDISHSFWYYRVGETVIIKFCTLDYDHFLFWKTLERQSASEGNPFASPSAPKTNIAGSALGIWGGYGVYLDTITCVVNP